MTFSFSAPTPLATASPILVPVEAVAPSEEGLALALPFDLGLPVLVLVAASLLLLPVAGLEVLVEVGLFRRRIVFGAGKLCFLSMASTVRWKRRKRA